MLDKLTGMRTFVAAVQTGSFIAAAGRLSMSPQMVARHIATLEKQLKTRLLNRTTRRQSLTPAGSLYYRRCEAILKAIDTAEREASGTAEIPSGTLRLNAPVTFGRYALVDFLSQFLRRYPQMSIELTLSDEIINPATEGFDMVIRIGEPDKNLRFAAKPLPAYRLIACAAPQYLAEHGWPEHPSDLKHHACLGFSPWPAGLTHQWPFVGAESLTEVSVNSRLAINDWGAILEAALKGLGVLIGYEKGLEQPVKKGQLVTILEDYRIPERVMNLLYDASRANETRYRVFIDELCEYFN
ncbi:LysR substrate-binding domain-containing protein [Samsonia erythrinae]|uniref:DNA-binding transcriptional LysR family regulator n=1 Tax=Samsonia erythrinae TaxID=160434 RepID=A0A4R3VR46_9GAMM|nr:LysR family transcriptional regulator [Samsonia erythrinae]TCV07842.1 DNA-binding transcriptional LysR family regulator [Samsonia erythrinae]